MSSSNKTENFNLSQFVNSDKPTFLGDYNGDMLKIDTALKNIKNTSDNNTSSIATASANANSALSNAEKANEKATEASNTAVSALSKSTDNERNISLLMSNFNISNFNRIQLTNSNISNATLNQTGFEDTITIASNNSNSIGKIYGTIVVNVPNRQTSVSITFNSNLRPSSDFFISTAGFFGNTNSVSDINISIKTNGDITLSMFAFENGLMRLMLFPCLYFFKDFGDTATITR